MKRLYPIVAGLFLFSTTALTTSPQVQAFQATAPGEPVAAWRIGSVQARGDDRPAYCAMVNQFTNGAVLAFARNAVGAGSLAVDFRRDLFETGKSYSIVVKVDKDTERRLDAVANSTRSVIIQTGEDSDLFRAFARNGDMTVILPKVAFSFTLDRFAQSYVQMGACLETIGASLMPALPVAPVASEVMPVDSLPVRQSSALEERAQAIRLEEDRIAQEWNELRKAQDAKKTAQASVKAEPSAEMAKLEAARKDVERLKKDLERKEGELEKRIKSHEAEASRLQAQYDELQEFQRKAVDQAVYDDKTARDVAQVEKTLGEERATIEKMKASRAALAEKEAKAGDAPLLELALKQADLDGQIESQKSLIASLEDELKRLKAKSVKPDSGAEKSQELITLMDAERKQLLAAREERDKELSSKRKELDDAHARIAELEKKVDEQKVEFYEEQEEKLAAVKSGTPRRSIAPAPELIAADDELENREALLREKMKAHAEEVAAFEREKADFEARKIALNKVAEAKGSREAEDLKAKTTELQDKVDLLTQQIEEKTAALAEKEKAMIDLKAAVLAQTDTESTNRKLLDQANAEIAALKQQKSEAEVQLSAQREISGRRDSDLEILRSKYSEQSVSLQTAMTEIKSLNLVRDDQRARIETLQVQLSALDEKYKAEKGQGEIALNQARSRISELEKQQAMNASQMEKMTAQLSAYQASEELAARWKDGRFSRAQVYNAMPAIAEDNQKQGLLGRLTGKKKEEKVSLVQPQAAVASSPTEAQWYQASAQDAPVEAPLFPPALESLLQSARVPLVALLPAEGAGTPGEFPVYRWSTGRLIGSLKQSRYSRAGSFDAQVSDAIGEFRQQCGNNAEVALGVTRVVNGMYVSSADVLCRSTAGAKAASLLFYGYEGVFTAITHEGGYVERENASRVRDDIASVLNQPLNFGNSGGERMGAILPGVSRGETRYQ